MYVTFVCRGNTLKVENLIIVPTTQRKQQEKNLIQKVWLLFKNIYLQWVNGSEQKRYIFSKRNEHFSLFGDFPFKVQSRMSVFNVKLVHF